jgi:hypothetical protein
MTGTGFGIPPLGETSLTKTQALLLILYLRDYREKKNVYERSPDSYIMHPVVRIQYIDTHNTTSVGITV